MKSVTILFVRAIASPLSLALLSVLIALSAGGARAQSPGAYKDLHDFGGTVINADGVSGPDGYHTFGGVTFDANGNMYGTTYAGGPNGNLLGHGMVWEITKSGQYKDLHDFGGTVTNANGLSGPDGWFPSASVTFDSQGNMYGTTTYAGPNQVTNSIPAGMVWEITTSGEYKDLHDFGATVTNANGTSGPDGSDSAAVVTFDGEGNIYGTALGGPNDNHPANNQFGDGMLWEITKSGEYKDLHDFGGTAIDANGTSGPDGINPAVSVTFDGEGNMYGAARLGGGIQFDGGMVWEITTSGQYKDLHDFGGTVTNANGTSGPDGVGPSGVTFDGEGNMYGTAGATAIPGGETSGGMVWEITTSGQYKDLHDFGGTVTNANGKSGPDGESPEPATLDDEGNIYGTTGDGGANGGLGGMVWEITTSGEYKDLHDFGGTVINADGASGPDGEGPQAGVAFYGAGNMYGTTLGGGANNITNADGMVWEIVGASEAPAPMIGPNGGTLAGPQPVTITDSLNGASIYYTTNGTAPTTNSTPYTGQITVSSSETIKAIAVASGNANSTVASAAFTIVPLTVQSLVLLPTSVIGGASSTATVKLSGTVAVDTTVTVTSSSTKATITGTVTVSAGQSSANFTIKTSSVSALTTATIKAAVGASAKTAPLSIKPLTVTLLTLSPASVIGGAPSTGTIKLDGPAPSDTNITVASGSFAAVVTSPVAVSAGQSSITFPINTIAVTALTSASIKATLGASSVAAALSVKPLTPILLTVSPTSVIGGSSSTGTIKLNGAAPADTSVTVSSNSGAVTVSNPVTVPAGQSSATFTINTSPVAAAAITTIKAALGTASKSAALAIKATTIAGFSVNPTSVVGGAGTSTLTITLSGNAPAAGSLIKLTSSLPSVLTVTNTTVPDGTNTVQVTLSPIAVTASKTITIMGILNGVSKTTVLSVTP